MNNLNYVILGSTENPMYLDFWHIVSKVWRLKFNVVPILGLICDEESDFYNDEYGIIKKFKINEKCSAEMQSQIIRIYLPSLLNGFCLISDIDMIPLSTQYFIEECEKLDTNNIIVFNAYNSECLKQNMYPMCYISAHSTIFKKQFIGDDSWEDFCEKLNSMNCGWYTDQKFIFNSINDYNEKNKNCIFLSRGYGDIAERRIDRMSWNYDDNKLSQGYYIDCHSLRPYREHKNEIDSLVNKFLNATTI